MKKHAKLLVLVVALVMVLSVVALAACNKNATKHAYGLVHGKGYVGKATVVVENGVLVSANLDEACLPTYVKAAEAIENYTVEGTYSNHGNIVTAHFYKTVKFAGVTMTYDATLDGDVSKGYMVGTQTMLEYFATEANCEKYFEAVASDSVAVVLASGDDTTILSSAALLKTKNNYWGSPAEAALGWKANVEATCAYVVANGFDGISAKEDLSQVDHSSSNAKLDNEWVDKNNVNTGATWTDFWDYFSLLKSAYNK